MTDAFKNIKVAAVQAAPVYMDREATVEKTCRLIEEAADQGAKIVAFPECFISSYPYFYGPLYDVEGIVYADINLEQIVEAKLRHYVLGHYARFDVLSLNFNDEKLVPLHYGHGNHAKQEDFSKEIKALKIKIDHMEQIIKNLQTSTGIWPEV